jgi:pimeloyl-ACP methyl ester carboxylesterase
MPRSLHPIRAALLAIVLAALALTAAPAGAAEHAPVPQLQWKDCDDGFQCATAEVPRDYSRPHGATIELALIRRPATDREHRIGSLFLNPGGPGGSGVEFVRTMPPPAQQIVGRLFDIVGFDPRGIGDSRPAVDCADAPASADPLRFMTPETLDVPALLRGARDRVQRCLTGPHRDLAPYLTTANVARDLDRLRAAVGDEKLTYFGQSYGGLIGETYATLFPGRSRALVLDSPVDGDVWLNRPLERIREQESSSESVLGRFFATCAAHQDACGFGGDDPEAAYDALLERLDREPVPVPDGPAVSGDEVRALTLDVLPSKFDWPLLATALARLQAGDPSVVLQARGGGETSSAQHDAFTVYDATEARYPHHVEPYLEDGEDSFALFEHFAIGSYERVNRALWPIRPKGAFYGPYRHAASSPPALVLASTHDPNAPYRWAKRVVADLGNARLLTLHGDGHGVLVQLNTCALVAFLAYIEDGDLPPAGATCEQDIPFAVAPALSARRSPGAAWHVPSSGPSA